MPNLASTKHLLIGFGIAGIFLSAMSFYFANDHVSDQELLRIRPIQVTARGETAKFELPIPPNTFRSPAISARIRTEHRLLRSGHELSRFGDIQAPKNERGSIRHTLSLRDPISEKSVFLEITNPKSSNWIEGDILLAEESTLVKRDLARDAGRLALGIGFIFLGAFALVSFARYLAFKELLLFGIFTVLAGIWTLSLCSRSTLAIFPFNIDAFWGPAVYWTTFIAMPILLALSRSIAGKTEPLSINSFLYWCFSAFAIVSIGAALSGIATLRSFNFAFNGLLACSMPLLLISHIFALRRGFTDSLPFIAGISGLITFWLLDSLDYIGVLSSGYENPKGHVGIAILVVSLGFILGKKLERVWVSFKATHERLMQSEKKAAISNLTQMLAHDVRRPFTMLQILLDIIKSSRRDEISHLIDRFSPEIENAIKSVNGLIADVMEAGSIVKPSLENHHIEDLIESSLKENLVYPAHDTSVQITYQFGHRHKLYVDRQKATRAFSNIISNAVQAMAGNGSIWFKSEELDGMMQITIGNSNSYIDAESISRIFDEFFTHGKKNGTGLGLAIARKVVADHGGLIRCQSSKEEGTEFIFTLPLSEERSKGPGKALPRSSKELQSEISALKLSLPTSTFDTAHPPDTTSR